MLASFFLFVAILATPQEEETPDEGLLHTVSLRAGEAFRFPLALREDTRIEVHAPVFVVYAIVGIVFAAAVIVKNTHRFAG